MTRRVILVALVLLLAPLTLGHAAAAGSSQETSTPIGEGTFSGSVARHASHWYVVDVPSGQYLRVSFTLVSGDDWDGVDIVGADGVYVAGAGHNETAAFDPDASQAWIVVRPFWADLGYSFTVALVDAPAQDDAGTGRDAGQTRAYALPVQPGRIAGAVRTGAGDLADWYRLDLPGGSIADLGGAVSAWVDAYDADGHFLGEIAPYDTSYAPRTLALQGDGRPLYFVVRYAPTYAFTLDVSLPGDLAVQRIDMAERHVETSQGATVFSVSRQLSVTLANVGAGVSRDAWLTVTTEHEGPTGIRTLYDGPVALAAGETAVVTFPWDHTGQLGDFEVVARVTNTFDANVEDNEERMPTFLLVGGLPLGVDLLNHQTTVGGATVRAEHGERTGLDTPAGFVGSDDGQLIVG